MSDNHYQRPGSFRLVTIGATVTAVLPADARRRAIIFGAHATASYALGVTQEMALASGLLIPAAAKPFKVCCCDLGSLVTREWYAIASAGATTVAIIEVLAGPGEED